MWSRVETQCFLIWELGKPTLPGLSVKQECGEVVHQMSVPITHHLIRRLLLRPSWQLGGLDIRLALGAAAGWGYFHRTPRTCSPSEESGWKVVFDPEKQSNGQLDGQARRGTQRKGKTRAGTGNDLALMGSTPHRNKGPHEWGFALRKPAAAGPYQY